ncbi:MogA/MoaB family molybdenum cofactor biosynthesis protein [bacterium]|nr:MogA/MoaB family molybdenum cofactor biosynthesis protein [bacterium]
MYKAGVITISDKGASGKREDRSGPALVRAVENAGIDVTFIRIVPDEIDQIEEALIEACDKNNLDLVLTTGGTGLSPRDVTPEATKKVIERDSPGFSEAIRQNGLKSTPYAMISRGVSGIRGKTLIINLPGSVSGATEGIHAILSAIPHALAKLCGDPAECGKG